MEYMQIIFFLKRKKNEKKREAIGTKKITSAMEVHGRFLGEKFPRTDALAFMG